MNRLVFYVLIAVAAGLAIASFWSNREVSKALPFKNKESAVVSELDTWRQFNAPLGTFSAKFPGDPQKVSEKTLDSKTNQVLYYDIFAAETLTGNKFVVTAITYPKNAITAANKDSLLARVMHDMVGANKKNELVNATKNKYNGSDAYDFEVKTPQNYIRTKTFTQGETVYVLSSISPIQNEKKEEFDFFINAFSLKK